LESVTICGFGDRRPEAFYEYSQPTFYKNVMNPLETLTFAAAKTRKIKFKG
jgi:hypothetical protein